MKSFLSSACDDKVEKNFFLPPDIHIVFWVMRQLQSIKFGNSCDFTCAVQTNKLCWKRIRLFVCLFCFLVGFFLNKLIVYFIISF